jgi:hypothetical protein
MKILFFFLVTVFHISSFAQTEVAIRNHYTTVNKQIAESIETGYEGPLCQNQVIINKNGKSWSGSGFYADTVNFWYNAEAAQLSAAERDPKTHLLKITTNARIGADVRTGNEYLFSAGKLVFHYAYWKEEGNSWETRIWFSQKGAMFKSNVKANNLELTEKEVAAPTYTGLKPNAAQALANAKKYMEVFLKLL